MKTIPIISARKIRQAVPKIEEKIKIKLSLNKKVLTIRGTELNEYITEKIIQAIDFGFEPEDALLLRNENFLLEFVNIKEHTHRHHLEDIRSRVIGRNGKAKRTIEELTGAVLHINENSVGIIVDAEHVEQTIQAIISLVQGSKHSNVFAYLEKQNAKLRHLDTEDLGLKNPEKDLKN